ncbi:MAG: phosphotransferase [Paracoccaceae bacterium]
MARALARLHARPAPPGLRPTADGSTALARDTRAILARCPTESAAPLFDLAPRGSVPPSGAACLLHGDAVPGNLIRTRAGIALIDWQCPAVGDPVHDLAVFLSPAMQLIYRGSALSPAETAGFLGSYGRTDVVDRYRALAPWLHWRIAAYCLWRSTQAAADYEAAMALELQHLPS